MTRSLAHEVAPVRVNLIAAGLAGTPRPTDRIASPADIAALAVHLMTNTAVTGATFDIGRGQQLTEG
jgi:NAD(P)-dependent dehydrogenase (short-subunit alcohol dehydrogenase family)